MQTTISGSHTRGTMYNIRDIILALAYKRFIRVCVCVTYINTYIMFYALALVSSVYIIIII